MALDGHWLNKGDETIISLLSRQSRCFFLLPCLLAGAFVVWSCAPRAGLCEEGEIQCNGTVFQTCTDSNLNDLDDYDVVAYLDGQHVVAETKDGVNIKTGTTGVDDGSVIQAALDSLTQGGKALIRAGTYTISNMLLIKYSNTEVSGAGIDKTILFNNCVNAQPLGSGIVHSNVHHVLHSRDDIKLTGIVVRHMTIDGNTSQIPKDNGAMLSNVDDSGFEYIKVQNSIGGLYVTSWEQGIGGVGKDEIGQHMEYSGLKFIRHCVADNCSAEGLVVCRSTNAELIDNVVTNPWLFDNGWCHMVSGEDSDQVLIKNNKIYNMPNVAPGPHGDAIDAIQTCGATNVVVEGNYVDFAGPIAAYALDSKINALYYYTEGADHYARITIINNTFKGAPVYLRNAPAAGGITGRASKVTIANNIIHDGPIYIRADGNCSFRDVDISANKFTFEGNTFPAAIHIRGGNVNIDQVAIKDNELLDKAHWSCGIKLQSVDTLTVSGNTCGGGASPGLNSDK